MKSMGLKYRVMFLVLMVLIPAFCLLLISYFQQLDAVKSQARERALAGAKVGAGIQTFYIKQAEQLLNTVGAISFLVLSKNHAFVTNHLINLKTLSPNYSNFGLIEAGGEFFADTLDNGRDTERLEQIRKAVVASKTFSVVLPDDLLAKEAEMLCGIPVMDEKGGIARVFFAALKMEVLHSALQHIPTFPGQKVLLFDQTAYFRATKSVSINKGDKSLEKPIWETEDSDGSKSIYGVSEVANRGRRLYLVGIAVPASELNAAANVGLAKNLIVMSIVAVLLLSFSRFWASKYVLTPLEILKITAEKLEKGDLDARAHIPFASGELTQLSRTFNGMAKSLSEREMQLTQANKEVKEANSLLERRVEERTGELKVLNEELEAFSYSVSHDLRAPLRHIGGFAELLELNPTIQSDEKCKKQLDAIKRSVKLMGTLIDDLLSFSRMARLDMVVASVNMEDLARQVVKQISGEEITITIESLPTVAGDPSMLKQVWVNLLNNAVKYTRGKESRLIHIYAVKNEDGIAYHVKDNGAGFDMKYANKLFGVFQRLHRADQFEGTGIGLANVKRIIHRHGGKVWAEGEVGIGARFSFLLPQK